MYCHSVHHVRMQCWTQIVQKEMREKYAQLNYEVFQCIEIQLFYFLFCFYFLFANDFTYTCIQTRCIIDDINFHESDLLAMQIENFRTTTSVVGFRLGKSAKNLTTSKIISIQNSDAFFDLNSFIFSASILCLTAVYSWNLALHRVTIYKFL